MCLRSTNSFLHIKFGLLTEKSCCDSYELPDAELLKISTNQSYVNSLNESQIHGDDETDCNINVLELEDI